MATYQLDCSAPMTGCLNPSGWVRCKFKLRGRFTLQDLAGSGVQHLGAFQAGLSGTGIGASAQPTVLQAWSNHLQVQLQGSASLNVSDFADFEQPQPLGAFFFNALSAGVSSSLTFHDVNVQASLTTALDPDMCFFCLQPQVTLHLPVGPPGDAVARANLSGAVGLKFGPGLRTLEALAQRFGMPAVEKLITRAVPLAGDAAIPTILTFLRAVSLWIFAAEVGFEIMGLSRTICAGEYRIGEREGSLATMTDGYVWRVYFRDRLSPADIPQAPGPRNAFMKGFQLADRHVRNVGYLWLRHSLERDFNAGRRIPTTSYRFPGWVTSGDATEHLRNGLRQALLNGRPILNRY